MHQHLPHALANAKTRQKVVRDKERKIGLSKKILRSIVSFKNPSTEPGENAKTLDDTIK